MGVLLNDLKFDIGRNVDSLGLLGSAPGPDGDTTLSSELTEEKKRLRSDRSDGFAAQGWISHKELESLIGRLSFSHTSMSGRFGRALMPPLRRKLNAPAYQGKLPRPDIKVFQRWAGVLRAVCPRRLPPRLNTHQLIIYTDATTSGRIAASIVFDRPEFGAGNVTHACRVMCAADKRIGLF